MVVKAETRSKLYKPTMLSRIPVPTPQEIDTKQIWQRFRASLAAATYAEKNSLGRKLIYTLLAPDQIL